MESIAGIQWVEARDASQHPAAHRHPVEAEEACLGAEVLPGALLTGSFSRIWEYVRKANPRAQPRFSESETGVCRVHWG